MTTCDKVSLSGRKHWNGFPNDDPGLANLPTMRRLVFLELGSHYCTQPAPTPTL